MKITRGLKKELTEVAQEYLENLEHNCWHFVEEIEHEYNGKIYTFQFEGECASAYEPDIHYLEGAYCGDTGGSVTIENIEVQDLQVYDEENDKWIEL